MGEQSSFTNTDVPTTGEGEDDQSSTIIAAPPQIRLSGLLFGLSFYLIIGAVVVSVSDTAQRFVVDNRWLLIALFVVMVCGLAAVWVKQDLITASAKKQIGTILFIVIPLLLTLVGTVFLLPSQLQIIILRIVFLLIACLLPAVMYYLFIASRKSSLLQEYITNLARLGLFDPQKAESTDYPREESEFERRMRIISYIQKFEAVYGPIPEPYVTAIIRTTGKSDSSGDYSITNKECQQYTGGVGGYFSPETTIPVVIASLLIGLGWVLTLPPWEFIAELPNGDETAKLQRVLTPQLIPVHFAFLGTYFFALQMLFRRFVRKDLRANAYIAITQRILLAVIGTWVVIQGFMILPQGPELTTTTQTSLLVVSFVVGAFPPVAWQVVVAAFRTATGARFLVPSLRAVMPVSDLDGLTVWHQARLEEEDIENVPNMATADIVDLMLNTRIPPERIIDWVDQAILYTQIGAEISTPSGNIERGMGEKRDRMLLREHGIRNASELLKAYEKSEVREDLAQFEAILPTADRSRLRTMVDVLTNNPNLTLIRRWRR